MPNTLAHMGLQGVVTKSLFSRGDLKWIYIGCIIPDIPWIIQRIFMALPSPINLYDLRLYSIAQAAFFSCVILSLALAMTSRRVGCVALILTFNSLLHLILDACQIKWGNGVHLFAPVHWEMVNFGLFWPNGTVAHILTVAGLIFALFMWSRSTREANQDLCPTPRKWLLFIVLLAIYISMPLLFIDRLDRADSHYVNTFRHHGQRTGKPVILDRVPYNPGAIGGSISVFGEEIPVKGIAAQGPALVSIRGIFEAPDLIKVNDVHVHPRFLRSAASYIGLALVAAVWAGALARRRLPP